MLSEGAESIILAVCGKRHFMSHWHVDVGRSASRKASLFVNDKINKWVTIRMLVQ